MSASAFKWTGYGEIFNLRFWKSKITPKLVRSNAKADTSSNQTSHEIIDETAKFLVSANQVKVRYSIHDARVPAYFDFLDYLDQHRNTPTPVPPWKPNCQPPDLTMQENSCTDSGRAAVRQARKDKT